MDGSGPAEPRPGLFYAVQAANNRGDKEELARVIDVQLLDEVLRGLETRTQPSQMNVVSLSVVGNSLQYFLVDEDGQYGGVRFLSSIREGDAPWETVEELWHFDEPPTT
jgi:hypothetical protein